MFILRGHLLEFEVCERNVRGGFRVDSKAPIKGISLYRVRRAAAQHSLLERGDDVPRGIVRDVSL